MASSGREDVTRRSAGNSRCTAWLDPRRVSHDPLGCWQPRPGNSANKVSWMRARAPTVTGVSTPTQPGEPRPERGTALSAHSRHPNSPGLTERPCGGSHGWSHIRTSLTVGPRVYCRRRVTGGRLATRLPARSNIAPSPYSPRRLLRRVGAVFGMVARPAARKWRENVCDGRESASPTVREWTRRRPRNRKVPRRSPVAAERVALARSIRRTP